MKRLNSFLIKSFIGPLIISFFIVLFVLLMQFLWKYVDDLVGKGLDFIHICKLMFYALARFVPIALPISVLLASVMTIGKMGENFELTAFQASGISNTKIFKPLFILVILIGISSFLFSNYVMPVANLKGGSLLYDIRKKKPALNIKEGIFYNDIDGFSIKINSKSNDGQILNDIIIYDHTNNNGNNKVIVSESGSMQITKDEKFLELTLFNGTSYIENNNKNQEHRRTSFSKNLIRFDLSNFGINNSEILYKGHYAMLNNEQISKAVDSLQNLLINKEALINQNIIERYNHKLVNDTSYDDNLVDIKKLKIFEVAINKIRILKSITNSNEDDIRYRNVIISKHNIEWHRKLSLAFACLLMFLIGSSLGSIIKKGGFGIPLLISILLFVLYHVLSMIGEKSAKDLTLTPIEGMWMANLCFIPFTLLLIYLSRINFNLSNIIGK